MHDGIEHAGYLAFLGWLSFFPFLVILVSLAGSIGQSGAGIEFVNLFIAEIPEQFIGVLIPRIEEIVSGPPLSLQTISILAMVWTASAAVEGLRTILNRAYHVETPPAYIWRRLMSIVQFLVIILAIVIGMFLLVLAPPLWAHMETILGWQDVLDSHWTYIRLAFSATIVFLAVAASYYILPNIKQSFLRVLPGTAVVMLLWLVAAVLFSSYITNFQQVNLVYGSLEGIIIALLFFYILGVIYIFGAEVNYHTEQALGRRFKQRERVPASAAKTERRKRKS